MMRMIVIKMMMTMRIVAPSMLLSASTAWFKAVCKVFYCRLPILTPLVTYLRQVELSQVSSLSLSYLQSSILILRLTCINGVHLVKIKGVVQMGVAQMGVVQMGVVQMGVVQVQMGLVQMGLVQMGVVQMGVVQLGVVQLGLVQLTPQSKWG